eukprot:scaffold9905_cov117-Isochrysis_galbana.AAC.17
MAMERAGKIFGLRRSPARVEAHRATMDNGCLWEWKGHKHLGTKAIGGTRRGGTCGDCGRQTTNPDESQNLQTQTEGPRARARRGRTCCCRSIVVERRGRSS